MNNKLPPQEQMVILPIGMDCRGLRTTKGWEVYWNWRIAEHLKDNNHE